MRVLVAPDRFGGTLPAPEVAAAVRDGWTRAAPADDVRVCALSDGGPGLVGTLHATLGGELVPATVASPLGDDVPAAILLVADGRGVTAYVEAAHATGHALVPADRRDPARTSSAGVGRLLAAARATGARRVVVGLGPAATHDAGAGMLAALLAGPGVGPGGALDRGAASLGDVTDADLTGLADVRASWSGIDLVAACDTDLPLLGLHGSSATAAVRGEVPGGLAQDIERAVAHLAHTAVRVLGPTAVRPDLLAGARSAPARLAALPGAGAGGGVGFALALLGARLLPGAAVVADAVGLTAHVADADLVVTGVGRLDPIVLHGAVVTAVAEKALAAAVPTVVLAQEVLVGRRELAAAGIAAAYPVRSTPEDDAVWHADPGAALAARAERVARTWSR